MVVDAQALAGEAGNAYSTRRDTQLLSRQFRSERLFVAAVRGFRDVRVPLASRAARLVTKRKCGDGDEAIGAEVRLREVEIWME